MQRVWHVLRDLREDKSLAVLLTLSAIKFLIHVLTSEGFGYFRDEFYYIAASKHLDFGYVDFPPFIAVVTRLVRGTLGESLLALHILPALAGAALVFLAGWMARQLGASPFGQALAALATLVAPQFLGVNSILSMDSFDILFLAPYVIWNAMHGWPTLAFWAAYGNKVYQASPLEFFVQQILIMHPFTFPLWAMGLVYFFSKRGATYRPFGWMYVVLFLIFMIQHAKNYFLAPIYPVLFAAGAVLFEQIAQRRPWLKPTYVTLLVVSGIILAPLAMPLLPVQATVSYVQRMSGTNVKSEKFDTGVLPQQFADRLGWEEMAATAAQVYHSLPAADQTRACIFTGNYGEAGALEFYGPRYGLPHVISGHNSYYIWGPDGCSGETVILIGAGSLEDLRQVFSDVQEVSQTQCEFCMPFENHLPIYVAHGLKAPLKELWPGVKSFG